jgi:hypothetical protein
MSQTNEPHALLADDIVPPQEDLAVMADPSKTTTPAPTTVPPNIGTK